jgi:hypothetical protein
MNTSGYIIICLCTLFSCNTKTAPDAKQLAKDISDPLPLWNDGDLKKAIVAYITQVTDSDSKDFIPVTDRIATFDNDGTLWAEMPYVQELFAYYRVKKMIEKNPSLATKQPFKAVVEHDKRYFSTGGEKALIELIVATHTNLSETDFETEVHTFYADMKYPGRNVSVKQITYQPQIELLNYLRANGFKTYICTGGTTEFVRSISEECYGVPQEQVIGTSFQYVFVDSNRSIFRKPALGSFNDKESKPVNIQLHIGRPPVFACGNEGGEGDIAMLKFCQSSKYLSFQLLVNHNDSIREFYYQEKSNASLTAASKNNWHVIDMQKDWKEVFVK